MIQPLEPRHSQHGPTPRSARYYSVITCQHVYTCGASDTVTVHRTTQFVSGEEAHGTSLPARCRVQVLAPHRAGGVAATAHLAVEEVAEAELVHAHATRREHDRQGPLDRDLQHQQLGGLDLGHVLRRARLPRRRLEQHLRMHRHVLRQPRDTRRLRTSCPPALPAREPGKRPHTRDDHSHVRHTAGVYSQKERPPRLQITEAPPTDTTCGLAPTPRSSAAGDRQSAHACTPCMRRAPCAAR